MVRATSNLQYDPDFLTQFFGSNQKKNLLNAARTGRSSDIAGSSFVPAMVTGTAMGDQWPSIALRKDDKANSTAEPLDRGWLSRWLAEHQS
jgi:hypothetical protein